MRSLRSVITFVGLTETVGFVGAKLGGLVDANPWYDDLPKPKGWPPQVVFPLVWSLVNYPSLGAATALLWSKRHERDIGAQLAAFASCIVHNAMFGAVVNRAKRTDVYVAMDVLGIVQVVGLAISYHRVSPRAARELTPLVAWSIYTTAIKIALHRHNRRPSELALSSNAAITSVTDRE